MAEQEHRYEKINTYFRDWQNKKFEVDTDTKKFNQRSKKRNKKLESIIKRERYTQVREQNAVYG